MSTSKHTPGSWLFEGGCVETDGSPHSDRRTVIAQMISARYAGTVTAPGECEANGRLIAAAPELLTALREFSDSAARLDAVINGAESPASEAECLAQAAALSRDLVARARAALAKTGA